MNLIFGLGNPDKKYSWTRHNIGKDVLKAFAKDVFNGLELSVNKKLNAEIIEGAFSFIGASDKSYAKVEGAQTKGEGDQMGMESNAIREENSNDLDSLHKVILARPLCYMNEVGSVAAKLVKYYDVDLKNLLIIYDELDLPVGEYKLSFDKGSHIHNGILSIQNHLKSNKFWHLRVGVRNEKIPQSVQKTGRDPSKYVLTKFSLTDKNKLEKLIQNSLITDLTRFLSKKQ